MSEEEKIPLLDGDENSYEDEKNILTLKPVPQSIVDTVRNAYETGIDTFENNPNRNLRKLNYYLQMYRYNPSNFRYSRISTYDDRIDYDNVNFDMGYKLFFPELSGEMGMIQVRLIDRQSYWPADSVYLMEVDIKFRFTIGKCCSSIINVSEDLDVNVMLMVHVTYRPDSRYYDEEYPFIDEIGIGDIINDFTGPMEDTRSVQHLHIKESVSEDKVFSIKYKHQLKRPLRCGVFLTMKDNLDGVDAPQLYIQDESYIRFTRINPKSLPRR